jgi:CelD/BcsL family acetyltransferase involved in cellulose biosynthesis
MQVSVVHPQELGPRELAAWRAMQRSSRELLNPFLAPGFTLATGMVRSTTRVALLEEGADLVGFFPFDEGRLHVGRPIAPGVSDSQGVIHAPGFEWSVEDLLKKCRLDVWEFDHLIAEQLTAGNHKVARKRSPIIDVSGGYEKYAVERQQRSTKIFKSTLYKQRKLARDLGAVRFEFEVRNQEELRTLIRWKSAQFRRTGFRDPFSVRWIAALVWHLFETRDEGCSGILSVLYSSERMVAAHFGLRSESSLSCWFPVYDVNLARYSPGLSLHLKMVEAAAAAGLRHLDLGKGEEEYKQWLKTDDLTVGEGWIDRPSIVAVVRKVQRAPRRFASDLVLRHPGLRRVARKVRKQIRKHAGIVRSRK